MLCLKYNNFLSTIIFLSRIVDCSYLVRSNQIIDWRLTIRVDQSFKSYGKRGKDLLYKILESLILRSLDSQMTLFLTPIIISLTSFPSIHFKYIVVNHSYTLYFVSETYSLSCVVYIILYITQTKDCHHKGNNKKWPQIPLEINS